jgi:hypothetical protein
MQTIVRRSVARLGTTALPLGVVRAAIEQGALTVAAGAAVQYLRRRWLAGGRHAAVALLACLVAATPLRAQSIGLLVGDSARVFAAPGAKLAVPLKVDLAAAGSANFAALQAGLAWGAARLTFDSLRVASSTGFSLTANTASASSGSATFNAFGASALSASGALATAYFTAGSAAGGTKLLLTPTAAGNDLGQSVLSLLTTRNLDVCVTPSTVWGDVTDDGAVNVLDAQQIARASVGLTVGNATAVTTRGDVTADGAVNILDAQQIARFSVALSAAARVNTVLYVAPSVASVVLTPGTAQTLAAVGATVALSAEPRSAGGVSLTGCQPVSWSSADTTKAKVSASGVVTAIGGGTTSITATSGGVSASLSVTVPQSFPSSGLVAYLNLAGTTNDSTGNGINFVNEGGVFTADRRGVAGAAIKFQALGDQMSRTWTTFPKDDFTVSLWFKMEGVMDYQGFSLFKWGDTRQGHVQGYGVDIALDANWVYRPCSAVTNGFTVNALVASGYGGFTPACTEYSVLSQWNHFVLTAKAGNGAVYFNGALVRTFTYSSPLLSLNSLAYIGNHDSTAGSTSLTTRYLDDIAVWNRALTATEVAAVYVRP